MGKSDKHKKARKADFIKQKLKLGKGKEILQNATNTAIASKSIALPAQSLAQVKHVPTSRRNLSLPDLLIQCRHYSSSVKKEALSELHQLLVAYPFLLQQHLLPLIASISHLISDPVPTLRTATLALLTYIFDRLPRSSLESATTGLTLFTISALSSLDEGVRIDALKTLDLLLLKLPEVIVRGYEYTRGSETDGEVMGDKVIESLLGVLRVRSAGLAAGQGGYTSAASSDLSPSSRLAVLTTLSTFLHTSISPVASSSAATAPWYLSTSFTSPREYLSFVNSFTSTPVRSLHAAVHDVKSDEMDLAHLDLDSFYVENFSLAFATADPALATSTLSLPSTSALPSSSAAPAATTPAASATLLTLLHPTLLSSFLDSAPSAFSPEGDSVGTGEAHLNTISAVIGVAKELYWAELGGAQEEATEAEGIEAGFHGKGKGRKDSARKLLVGLLGHVGLYFPFGADELEQRSKEGTEKLNRLNLNFAEMVSLLVLSTPDEAKRERSSGKEKSGKEKERRERKERAELELQGRIGKMVLRVEGWVVGSLLSQITSSSYPLGQPLPPSTYSALEPTIWSLLNQPTSLTSSSTLLPALLTHFAKEKTGNPGKKLSFEFLSRIILIQSTPGYNNRFAIEKSMEDAIGDWIKSLPKFLWELGSRAEGIDTARLVVTFINRLAQQGAAGVISITVLQSLKQSLCPYFHLVHPSRGIIPGPFLKLPLALQKQVLNLVWFLLRDAEQDDPTTERLRGAIDTAVRGKGMDDAQRAWRGICDLSCN